MKPTDILHIHNLKRTSCREGIIEALISAGQALSENEIRQHLDGKYDRVTLYRSFQTLEDHKILHKIIIDNQIVKYALAYPDKEAHAHFFCMECHVVRCLESVPVPKTDLPEGYSETETEVLIKGKCSSCNDSTTRH